MSTNDDICKFLQVFQRLSPNVIFWKHLEDALLGVGDIDCFVKESELPLITKNVKKAAISVFGERLDCIYYCDHHINVRCIFLVVDDYLPRLIQIDLTYRQERFGAAWLQWDILKSKIVRNKNNLTVVCESFYPVIIFILYCLNSTGNFKIKNSADQKLIDKQNKPDLNFKKNIIEIFHEADFKIVKVKSIRNYILKIDCLKNLSICIYWITLMEVRVSKIQALILRFLYKMKRRKVQCTTLHIIRNGRNISKPLEEWKVDLSNEQIIYMRQRWHL